MTVSHLAGSPVPEPVRTEVENEVVVVRKNPEAKVDQIGELVHRFNVLVRSTESRKQSISVGVLSRKGDVQTNAAGAN